MKIICIGFYGHGNAGDEAMARAFDEYLRAPFENVDVHFSTEVTPDHAVKIAKQNPFYKERALRSVHDTECMREYDVVIVGGGNLPATWGISQVLKARESGRARFIARLGTSANDDFISGGDKAVNFVKSTLNLFDFVSVRDRSSYEILSSMELNAHMGADLAINFPIVESGDPIGTPYAALVVREVREDDVDRQVGVARAVVEAVKKEIPNIIVLPFCEKDEKFARNVLAANNVKVMTDAWRDPGLLQWVIRGAEHLTSVGRLHPLVFSVNARTPCCAVTYPWLTGYDKINAFMHHSGLGHRVADWGLPPGEIAEVVSHSIQSRLADRETLIVYGGHLKGLMLESLCPIWEVMGAEHGLGLERGLRKGQFDVVDYDDSYYYGARVYKAGQEFRIYHPTRGDWHGWDTIRDLVVGTMQPKTLIDVGCGRGWFIKRMHDSGIQAEGVDMSHAAWSDAAPGMKEFIKVGTLKDVGHRTYDVLTGFDVMEHIYEEDLHEAIRVMKNAAGRFIVLNICAAPDNEDEHAIAKGKPVPEDKEWLAVSGHVNVRHRGWWKQVLEDENWEFDEDMCEQWRQSPSFNFDSWQQHNLVILRRKSAS